MTGHPSATVTHLHCMAEGPGGVVAIVYGEEHALSQTPVTRSAGNAPPAPSFYAGLGRKPASTLLEACLTLADARSYGEVVLIAGLGDHLPRRKVSELVTLSVTRTIMYMKRPVQPTPPHTVPTVRTSGTSRFDLRRPAERKAESAVAIDTSNMNWSARLAEMCTFVESRCGSDATGHRTAAKSDHIRRLIVLDAAFLLPDRARWHEELAHSHRQAGELPARFAHLQKIVAGQSTDLLLLARTESEALSIDTGNLIFSQINGTSEHDQFQLGWQGVPVWKLPSAHLTGAFPEFYKTSQPGAYDHFQHVPPSNPSIDRPLPLETFTKGEIVRRLKKYVVGQDEAMRIIADMVVDKIHNRTSTDQRPIGKFLLPGPTGSGKTETAKSLARALFGRPDGRFVTIDGGTDLKMSAEPLFGLQPGYIGFDDAWKTTGGGLLTRPLITNPGTPMIFLIDELSRAHRETPDKLFQVLDEGYARDSSSGHTVSFRDTIFFFTTNDAAEQFIGLDDSHVSWTELRDRGPDLLFAADQEVWQRPFLGRFDAILPLCYPSREALVEIARRYTQELVERYQRFAGADQQFSERMADTYTRAQGIRSLRQKIDGELLGKLTALRQTGHTGMRIFVNPEGNLDERPEG